MALGVAAVHVVDDNFLQPQPGTSAGDHSVGGLIQTAFFVGLAWAYPRLRPGLRGTLAIFVGLFIAQNSFSYLKQTAKFNESWHTGRRG